MPAYTNVRPSKVTCLKRDWAPGQVHEVPEKDAAVLEAKDERGNLTHPLRKGASPVLQPGKVAMPAPAVVPKVSTLEALDIPRAQAQVRLCDDLDILAGWHASETRPEILTAIDERARVLAARKP